MALQQALHSCLPVCWQASSCVVQWCSTVVLCLYCPLPCAVPVLPVAMCATHPLPCRLISTPSPPLPLTICTCMWQAGPRSHTRAAAAGCAGTHCHSNTSHTRVCGAAAAHTAAAAAGGVSTALQPAAACRARKRWCAQRHSYSNCGAADNGCALVASCDWRTHTNTHTHTHAHTRKHTAPLPRCAAAPAGELRDCGSAVVYAGFKGAAEALAGQLRRARVAAAPYHAGLPLQQREAVQVGMSQHRKGKTSSRRGERKDVCALVCVGVRASQCVSVCVCMHVLACI